MAIQFQNFDCIAFGLMPTTNQISDNVIIMHGL